MTGLKRYLPLLFTLVLPSAGQTLVEHAAMTSAIGTGGVKGASGLGKSLSGAFSKVDVNKPPANVTTSTSHGGSIITLSQPKSKKGQPEEPAVTISTPSRTVLEQIASGTSRKDLIAKLGTPFFALTQSNKGTTWETITYRVAGGGNADFRLSEGKVESVKLSPPIPSTGHEPPASASPSKQ